MLHVLDDQTTCFGQLITIFRSLTRIIVIQPVSLLVRVFRDLCLSHAVILSDVS